MRKDKVIRFRVSNLEQHLLKTASQKVDETLSEFVKVPAVMKALKIMKKTK